MAIDRWIPTKGRTEEVHDEEESDDGYDFVHSQRREEESPRNHTTLSKKPTANGKGEYDNDILFFFNSSRNSSIEISVGGVRLNDEFDHIPIGELYTPSQKRPRKTAASTSNPGDRTTAAEERTSVTLADPDLLDCPICFEPLSSPVFQCQNGHIACASCCTTTLKNKCANCFLPIRNIRNRAIEKILESVIVSCQNKQYGCGEMFSYSKKTAHEKACNYVPCSCPFSRCNFIGSSELLYHHFASRHKDSAKRFTFNSTISISMDTAQQRVILQERKEGVLFVLNRCIRTLGSFCNVVCVAPSASEMRFVYELTAAIGDDLIKVKTSVEMMSKWTTQPTAEMSLLVPCNLISTSQLLKLDLIIRKKSGPAS